VFLNQINHWSCIKNPLKRTNSFHERISNELMHLWMGHLILLKIFENCALDTRIGSFDVLENQADCES
jgi:hypothetical protein